MDPRPVRLEVNVKQIGNYRSLSMPAAPAAFSEPSSKIGSKENPLYRGSEEYSENYRQNVIKHLKESGAELTSTIEQSIQNQTFFREKFVNKLKKINDDMDVHHGNDQVRKSDPEKETISMDEFLGKEGTKLYQLALEEELNSKAFMDAVLEQSTAEFEGENWAKRPIVIVAGPSASGKTTAANSAIKEASKFIEKAKENQGINKIIFVDGGKGREVSQMRKLVVNVANNKGYTGISDLQKKSKMLGKVKKRVYKYALKHTNYGLVIPETFSAFRNPKDKSRKILKDAVKCPNAVPIFTRVDGEDELMFKKSVSFMGSFRAWKRDHFDRDASFDLNTAPSCESKSYGAGGFKWGVEGSKLAEEWFKKRNKNNVRMLITNDLVLKRKEGAYWVNAEPSDEGVVMISKRAFRKWQSLPPDEQVDLAEYAKVNRLPPIIKTSIEIKNDLKVEDFRKKIEGIIKESIAELGKPKKNVTNEQLLEHIKMLESIVKSSVINSPEQIRIIRDKIQQKMKLPQYAKELNLSHLSKLLDGRLKSMSGPERSNVRRPTNASQYGGAFFARRDTTGVQVRAANDEKIITAKPIKGPKAF